MFKADRYLYLLIICLVHIALFLMNNPGPPSADDKIYYEEAVNITEGDWQLSDSPKNHRFGIILPVAGLVAMLGSSSYVLAIWPLLFSLATVILLYRYLNQSTGQRAAVIGAALLALSLNQVIYASSLFPDVIVSFFFLLIPLLLYQGLSSGKRVSYGILAGLLVLPALFVRENILFIIPAVTVLFLFSWSVASAWKMFLAFFVGAGISTGLWMLVFFQLSGDPLFVYHSVEAQYNQVFASPEGLALLDRLIFDPPRMFFHSVSFLPLLLLSSPVLLSLLVKRKLITDPTMWWSVFLVVLLLTFWFGTTSFNQYSLLLPLERLWLPLIPVLCIIAAFCLEGKGEVDSMKFRRRVIFFFTMIVMILSLFTVGWERFTFYLAFIVCLEGAWYGVQEESQKRKWELLVLLFPFIMLAGYFTITNSRYFAG